MKIGILGLAGKPIPTIEGDICAPHVVINNLVEQLSELGHDVVVLTGKDSKVNANIVSANLESTWNVVGREDENPISYTERKIEYDQILSREAIKLFKDGKLDIINSHDIRFSPYLFSQANVPVLYTPHFDLESRLNDYDRYRYQLMNNQNFGVANISQKNIKFCQKLGIKNYGYVPNGIKIENYQFSNQNRDGILLVGRMVEGKMIKEAIEIAGELNQTITLIGPPGTKDKDALYFNVLERNYFTRDYVKYLGYKKPEEIIPYYQKAQVLVFASASEGMPLVILEAMATGLPVVASAVGGINDIIEDGVDGCLVYQNDKGEWAKKIEQALKIKNDLCRKKIEENFTLEKSANAYILAYRKFIDTFKDES